MRIWACLFLWIQNIESNAQKDPTSCHFLLPADISSYVDAYMHVIQGHFAIGKVLWGRGGGGGGEAEDGKKKRNEYSDSHIWPFGKFNNKHHLILNHTTGDCVNTQLKLTHCCYVYNKGMKREQWTYNHDESQAWSTWTDS